MIDLFCIMDLLCIMVKNKTHISIQNTVYQQNVNKNFQTGQVTWLKKQINEKSQQKAL